MSERGVEWPTVRQRPAFIFEEWNLPARITQMPSEIAAGRKNATALLSRSNRLSLWLRKCLYRGSARLLRAKTAAAVG